MKPKLIRILYLDKIEKDRIQVREILQQEPGAFEITECDTSKKFEALLSGQKFDLVLCDVNVPGLSGLDALEKVLSFNSALPVILLTGSQNGQLGVESIQHGAADLIIKSPATLSILSHKIRMVMDRIKADEKRRESELRYNDMIRRTPVGVYIVRAKPGLPGRFEYISSRCCEILGVIADEVLANADVVDKAAHPNDREEFSNSRKAAEASGQSFVWEGRFNAAGEVRWVRIESEPMLLPDGDILWNGVVVDITGRKHMEEQILQNEAIFSSFMENSPVYVFFKDRDIRALRLSSNYEQMLGMPISQALGKTMDDLFPSELSKSMLADDRLILNEGKRVNVVEEMNGRIYETTKFPIFKDGKPEMLAGFTLDITERMEAERLLHKSEEFSRALISQSPIGIAVFSNTGEIIFGNEAWKNVWGYSEEEYQEIRNQKYPELMFEVLDEYVKDHWNRIQQVYAKGGSLYLPDLKIPNTRPGGAEWVSEYYYAIMDEHGQVERVVTLTEDISARKQAEQALHYSEELNQAIISQSPIGIAIFTPTGVLFFANAVWKKIWGYSEQKYEESRKRKFPELIFDEMDRYIKDHQDKVRQVYEKGGTLYLHDLKIPNPLPGGADWVSQYYYAITDENGKVERIVTLTEDVSARKETERALRYSEDLNQTLISQSPIGIAVFNNTGTPLFGNASWRRIWGISEKEYRRELSRPYKELGFDEVDEYLKDHIDLVRNVYKKGGNLYLPDLKIPNPQPGAAEWVSQYYYAIKDEHGQVERVVTLTEDISARKQAEAEIIRSRAILERVQEVAHLGSVEINLTNQTVIASAEARRIYGWNKELVSLADVQTSALPEYRAEIDAALEKLIHLKEKFDIQYKIKRESDGAIRDVHALAEYNPEDNSVVGSIQDITERKLIMQVLMENEEKFRTLFEKANDMIFITDINDRILDVNNHTLELTGYSRDELLKMKIPDLQAEEIRGQAGSLLKIDFNKYGNAVIDSIALHKNGSKFPVEITLSRISIASRIRFIAIVRDVSERKRIEQELKEQIETLERIHDVTVDRELRMVDLKKEVNALLLKTGEKEKYNLLDI